MTFKVWGKSGLYFGLTLLLEVADQQFVEACHLSSLPLNHNQWFLATDTPPKFVSLNSDLQGHRNAVFVAGHYCSIMSISYQWDIARRDWIFVDCLLEVTWKCLPMDLHSQSLNGHDLNWLVVFLEYDLTQNCVIFFKACSENKEMGAYYFFVKNQGGGCCDFFYSTAEQF